TRARPPRTVHHSLQAPQARSTPRTWSYVLLGPTHRSDAVHSAAPVHSTPYSYAFSATHGVDHRLQTGHDLSLSAQPSVTATAPSAPIVKGSAIAASSYGLRDDAALVVPGHHLAAVAPGHDEAGGGPEPTGRRDASTPVTATTLATSST